MMMTNITKLTVNFILYSDLLTSPIETISNLFLSHKNYIHFQRMQNQKEKKKLKTFMTNKAKGEEKKIDKDRYTDT